MIRVAFARSADFIVIPDFSGTYENVLACVLSYTRASILFQ